MQSDRRIDAEYDPEFRVGSRTPYVDWYVRQSALALAALEHTLNIPFGPAIAETLDIFPSPAPDSPVLIFIHGGYWRALSSKEFSFVANGFVGEGVTVAITNYSLCPKVTINEITQQSVAALRWLAGSVHKFNGDAQRMFVAGHSAGAQQAGMMLATDPLGADGPTIRIRGGIGISGIYDLRPLRRSWLQPTLRLTDALISEQSPLLQIRPHHSRLLISAGGNESDAFLDQSRAYYIANKAAEVDAQLFIQPGLNHFESIYGLGDSRSELSRVIREFMRGATVGV